MKQLPLPEQTEQHQAKANPKSKLLNKRLLKPSRQQWIYVTLGLAACTLTVLALRPTLIAVDTKPVERGTLKVTVNAEGKTRIKEDFVISAPVNGRLKRIELDEGDLVKKESIVARIDPLPLNSAVKEALGRLAEAKSQRQGVATLRPKSEQLAQARSRISVARASQLQAEAKVAQTRAAFEQAQHDAKRAGELATKGVISSQDRERAELEQTTRKKDLESAILAAKTTAKELEVAQAALKVLQKEQSDPDYLLKVYDSQIASIEAKLSKLQDDASRTNIRSPIEGKVLRVLQKSSSFVSEGTPLIKVGDPKDLELVIDALSQDAIKIKPGNPILIEEGNRDIKGLSENFLKAKVRLIEPSAFTKVSALGVEEQRVNVIGDFVEPPVNFGDAYRVDVQIVVWEGKNILKAPLSSLFRCDDNWCVFVVRNSQTIKCPDVGFAQNICKTAGRFISWISFKGSKAHRQSVKIGNRSNYEVEIRQGLSEGEVVILHPSEQIEADIAVKSRQQTKQ